MFFTLISSLSISFIAVFLIAGLLSLSFDLTIKIFLVFVFLQWFMAPRIVKGTLRFQYLKKDEIPWLESLVSELSKQAGVRKPRIALKKSDEPNAFVFGRTPLTSTLVLHTGLIMQLEKEELAAVIAHELGHIKRYDCSILTLASIGPLILQNLSYNLFNSAEESLDGRLTSIPFAVMFYFAALVFHVAYFITNIFLLWLSRLREYYADSFAATITDPHDLEVALAKISYGLALEKEHVNPLRLFCIEDQMLAKKEIYRILENKKQYDLDGNGVLDKHEIELAMLKEYDLDKDGRLDGHELQHAMRREIRCIFHRMDEFMSTHPPTYRRIDNLDQIGKHKKPKY